jgi:hypothetical protein
MLVITHCSPIAVGKRFGGRACFKAPDGASIERVDILQQSPGIFVQAVTYVINFEPPGHFVNLLEPDYDDSGSASDVVAQEQTYLDSFPIWVSFEKLPKLSEKLPQESTETQLGTVLVVFSPGGEALSAVIKWADSEQVRLVLCDLWDTLLSLYGWHPDCRWALVPIHEANKEPSCRA